MTVTSSATVALRSMAAAGAQPRSLRVRVCGAARAGRGRPAQLGAPAARGDARPSGAARASRRRAARRWLATSAASVPEPSAPAAAPLGLDAALRYTSFVVPLAVLVALDKYLEAAVAAQGISFPAPLIGMFCLFGALLVLERAAPKAGLALSGFCAPAVQWITRWLPLFFVPSLVTLPLAVQGLSAAQVRAEEGRGCPRRRPFEHPFLRKTCCFEASESAQENLTDTEYSRAFITLAHGTRRAPS